MTDLTELDTLVLDRWHDAVGIRDALKELEDRLDERLEQVAERLIPWLEAQGYRLLDINKRYAEIEIAKPEWLKSKGEPLVWVSIAALFPYGFRRVQEEHSYVWVCSKGLPKVEWEPFAVELASRLRSYPERWVNEDCKPGYPAGLYIPTHGDRERIDLARSPEALESFVKDGLSKIIAIGAEIDATLEAVHRLRRPRPTQ